MHKVSAIILTTERIYYKLGEMKWRRWTYCNIYPVLKVLPNHPTTDWTVRHYLGYRNRYTQPGHHVGKKINAGKETV